MSSTQFSESIKDVGTKVLFVGPLKDFSGYANAARHYVRALNSTGFFDIVTRNVKYDGGTYQYNEVEKSLENKNLQDVEIVIQHTTPNETEKKPGCFNVNLFCWETDRIPQYWVNQLNQMDLVIVPCEENRIAARVSGVYVPIEIVPFTFNPEDYKEKVEPFFAPEAEGKFKFLTICQLSKKKGIDVLLRAYLSEFEAHENVMLMLKVYFSSADGQKQKDMTRQQVQKIKELMRLKSYPKTMVIHSVMNDRGIKKLYNTADCYVLPSRGEGWSITHFDAMGYGLPPIATNWGGPTEFITKDTGWLVDKHMSPCFDMPHPHDFMYTAKDNWPEPHIDSLRKSMREAYTEWKVDKMNPGNTAWSERISKCKSRVEDFSYDKVAPKLEEAILKHYRRWKYGY